MKSVVAVLLLAAISAVAGAKYPCYPPGSCSNFGVVPGSVSAMTSSVAGGPQVILQSNAVDVETDGGFVISLPTPPPASPDLPEFSEHHGAGSPVNKVIAHQRNKIALIEAKLSQKKQALAEHDTWLEQATRALERVKKQMRETKFSRKAIARKIRHLEENRRDEIKATRRAKLAKELEETRSKLVVLNEEATAVHNAKLAIGRKRAQVSKAALGYGKLLNWHTDKLKAKIQEFEDQEQRLAHVGGDDTPHAISNIDTLLQHDEDIRMADSDH
jgi:hypothetical protein